MRHYEIVLLVHPSRSEQVPAMLHRYKDMVRAAKGRVHRVEDWGRRRLAYMISEVHKAHYVMMNVECELDTLRELERNFKFNDSVVRSMVVRRARAETGQSAMAKAKAEEDRIEAEKAARAERGLGGFAETAVFRVAPSRRRRRGRPAARRRKDRAFRPNVQVPADGETAARAEGALGAYRRPASRRRRREETRPQARARSARARPRRAKWRASRASHA